MKKALRIISLFILVPIWLIIALPAFVVLTIHKCTEWLFKGMSAVLILAICDWNRKKVDIFWELQARRYID